MTEAEAIVKGAFLVKQVPGHGSFAGVVESIKPIARGYLSGDVRAGAVGDRTDKFKFDARRDASLPPKYPLSPRRTRSRCAGWTATSARA